MSGPPELMAAAIFVGLLAPLKIVNVLHYRFNSDESQHLHVIWGWTHGLIQYRDVFDNHMPLFQLLFAPIFGLVGERVSALFMMRFALLPVSIVAAWCTYRIGTLLFSRRVGVWAAILCAYYPAYFFCSLEFRPDNLWAPFILLCLTTLLAGPFSSPRALSAGLFLGLAFAVSMKSLPILVLLVLSAALSGFLLPGESLGGSWNKMARSGAAFLFSTALAPAIIMSAFALKGVWSDFFYCVFQHNLLPGADGAGHSAWWIVMFPISFPFSIYIARRLVRAAPTPADGLRRGFVFLFAVLYLPFIYSFWELISRQDYLPFYPLAAVFLSSALISGSAKLVAGRFPLVPVLHRLSMPACVALVEMLLTVANKPFWLNGAKEETDLLRDILALTTPDECVFDCKGETLFRRRSFYYALESITMERVRRGLMADDIGKSCIETRACVASTFGRLPVRGGQFILANYLPVTRDLDVAGCRLDSSPRHPFVTFRVVIPASYEIIARAVGVRGSLDGTPYQGARFLDAGPHTFMQTSLAPGLILLWAPAAERNYTPFHYRARAYRS